MTLEGCGTGEKSCIEPEVRQHIKACFPSYLESYTVTKDKMGNSHLWVKLIRNLWVKHARMMAEIYRIVRSIDHASPILIFVLYTHHTVDFTSSGLGSIWWH